MAPHGAFLRSQPFRAVGPAEAEHLNCSGYWLMELELIEPSLYLRMDKGAPERFARALHDRVCRVESCS